MTEFFRGESENYKIKLANKGNRQNNGYLSICLYIYKTRSHLTRLHWKLNDGVLYTPNQKQGTSEKERERERMNNSTD